MTRFLVTALSAVTMLFTLACAETDPGITAAVKSRLTADDTVKAYQIDVDTNDRVVTLTGAVDTSAAKTQAVAEERQESSPIVKFCFARGRSEMFGASWRSTVRDPHGVQSRRRPT